MVEGLLAIYVHVQSCMVVYAHWFGVNCDIQERKKIICTRFSIFNTATMVPLPIYSLRIAN